MSALVPNIVASQSFINQTVALASTTLYTPSAAGLFRINAYWQWKNSGSINPAFSWSDDLLGAQSYNDGAVQSGDTFMGSFMAQVSASAAIALAVAMFSSPTWSLYVSIEQLI